ncbi:SusC/RagA family TonB-linked outer membrane protein [Chitinophaga defluvii]|uniref:SusC/RagA family TonB-linked outer membrane protein n=1 Tax=Chitinophaga defluvii TaxID=3163343 RepID=A0ABV2TCL0_9BACT
MKKMLSAVLAMICFLLPLMIQAQQKTVTGKVTDRNGTPLPGASIAILNGRQGVVTNAAGKFEIAVPPDARLTVYYTGYKTNTIKVTAGTDPLNIILEEDVARLDEVIVTGLATTVKRRNSANAVATVSASELAGISPAQTFDAALNGKITGANIVANSGAPGGGISVKLRGVTTIYGNTEPLYVVDGVIVNNKTISGGMNAVTAAESGGTNTSTQDNGSNRIADINPADIENIEILKGASAAAIYGSQAAAGVVVITTKRGKAGKTKITVTQDIGIQTARKLMGVRQLNETIVEETWGPSGLTRYKAAVAAGKIYDYEKEMYGEKGFLRNTTVSMSGGSDRTTFMFSAGMRKEDGIILRTGYANNNLRLNVDHRISDRIKIGVSTAFINSSADRGLTNNDNTGVSFGSALSGTPSFIELHQDASGNYPRNPMASSNPIETRDKMTNNELTNRVISGVNLEATLQQSEIATTKFIARGGVDFYNFKTKVLFPASLQFERVKRGHNIQGNANNTFTNWAGFLVNTFTPNTNLSFTTSAGLTHEYASFDQILTLATQLVGTQTSSDQAAALDITQTRNSSRNDGIFVQEEIAFKEFLNFTAGVRFDKSTNNGKYRQFIAYPKANIAWNISKMGQWENETVSDLKLRVAYGEGNSLPTFSSRFTTLPIDNIGGKSGSLINIVLGNPDIMPERQTELEGGVDVSFLGGKIGLEATYYNKVIKDLLLLSDYQGATGFGTKWVNGGQLRNTGLELGLRTVPVNNAQVRWSSNINFWKNRSEVSALTVPAFDPGGSFGATYGTFFVQNNATATQIVAVVDDAGTTAKVGDTEPDFQMNFFNDLTLFKNLSLRFLIHWKKGGDNVNLSQLLFDGGGTSPDYDEAAGDGKLGEGRLLGFHSYVQDASYVRIREIGLYYRIPVKMKFMESITVGASANNYFTWTKYKGYDPEVSNFGAGFSTGVDVAPFPSSKRVQFHLALNF